jgi:mannan endo-1,4-beta-mannosidase
MLVVALAGCGALSPHTATSGPGRPGASGGSGSATNSAQKLPFDMSGLLDPTGGKFFGVEPEGAPAFAPVTTFAASVGRKPDIIGEYVAWDSSFDARAVATAWSYGALYYMAWEPQGTTLADIAGGQSDAYITRFATAVRALNLPVAISFGHEMNGNWYPWGIKYNTAAQFVAAWRHIHDLFVQAGAGNVLWVWNPNVISSLPVVALKPYYPGDAYVDWVGITGYFPTKGPHTFAALYGPTMTEVRQFTDKPFIIVETAVESGPAAVRATRSLVTGVERHPDVLGFIWFDYNKTGINWQVETRPAIRNTLARNLAGLQLIDPKT